MRILCIVTLFLAAIALNGLAAPVDQDTRMQKESGGAKVSASGWSNHRFREQKGIFTVAFNATPMESRMEGVTALSSGPGALEEDYQILVRFNPAGRLDAAVNTNGVCEYSALAAVPYTAGATFHIRIEVAVGSPCYSAFVYVRPAGGNEVLLFKSYCNKAGPVSGFDHLGTIAYCGSHRLDRVEIKDGCERMGYAFDLEDMACVVIQGDIYEITQHDDLTFLMNIYDPDFREKNYVKIRNKIYQKDPESGELFLTLQAFQDDFEGAEEIGDLFSIDRWHSYNADPKNAGEKDNYYNDGSRMTVNEHYVTSGVRSLYSHAKAKGKTTKASILRTLLYFEKGDTIHFSGCFYLDTPAMNGQIAILDFESDWVYNCPGIRLHCRDNHLHYEMKSFEKLKFEQQPGHEVAFPLGEWVHLEGRIFLSDTSGTVELWQNGVKIIDGLGRTLPLEDMVLNRVEVGLTAVGETCQNDKTLFVDNLEISGKTSKGGASGSVVPMQ